MRVAIYLNTLYNWKSLFVTPNTQSHINNDKMSNIYNIGAFIISAMLYVVRGMFYNVFRFL